MGRGAALRRSLFCSVRRAAAFVLCAIACMHAQNAAAWSDQLYLEIDSYARSEPLAIRALIKDFRGPLSSGHDAHTHNRMEIGSRSGDWQLAYVQRYDYEIKASRDFVEAYHALRNGGQLQEGRRYDLRLQGWHLRNDGLKVLRDFNLSQRVAGARTRLTAGGTLMRGLALTDGLLSGDGTGLDVDTLDYAVDVDYFYSRDSLFKREVGGPSGWGLGLDLAAALEWSTVSLNIRVGDLLGFMRWSNAPFTSARADSERGGERADGGLNPVLTGFEGFKTHRQRLHPRGRAELEWTPVPMWHLALDLRLDEVAFEPGLRAGYDVLPALRVEALAWPSFSAFGVGIRTPWVEARIASDSVNRERSRFAVIELKVLVPFR
jgi:hypothetical protein